MHKIFAFFAPKKPAVGTNQKTWLTKKPVYYVMARLISSISERDYAKKRTHILFKRCVNRPTTVKEKEILVKTTACKNCVAFFKGNPRKRGRVTWPSTYGHLDSIFFFFNS